MNNDTTTTALTPENPVQISSGPYHTVALLADASVACWGDNDDVLKERNRS